MLEPSLIREMISRISRLYFSEIMRCDGGSKRVKVVTLTEQDTFIYGEPSAQLVVQVMIFE